jgi:hypothetical protein
MGRVAVGAQQKHTGIDETLLAQDLVTDTPAYLKEMFNTLLGHKAAHVGMVLGMLGGGRRGGVVQGNGQPFRIFYPLDSQAVEYPGDSGGIIVAEGDVGGRVEHLTRPHFRQAGVFG